MALDTIVTVEELRARINYVSVSALLEANGTFNNFVRPGADIRAALGATIANSVQGEDEISLSTFVVAFGGNTSLLRFPKTLATVVDSDDDDDDTWEAAKPAPANDVIDKYNEMTRRQLSKLLTSEGVGFTTEDTMDEMRRRLRAADQAREEAEARLAAELREKKLQAEKAKAEALARSLLELFLAAADSSYVLNFRFARIIISTEFSLQVWRRSVGHGN